MLGTGEKNRGESVDCIEVSPTYTEKKGKKLGGVNAVQTTLTALCRPGEEEEESWKEIQGSTVKESSTDLCSGFQPKSRATALSG